MVYNNFFPFLDWIPNRQSRGGHDLCSLLAKKQSAAVSSRAFFIMVIYGDAYCH